MPEQTDKPLRGKVAVVTGASRRIGRETALGLARDGAAVVVTARSSADEIEQTASLIRAEGVQALPLVVDVTSEMDVNQAFGRIAAEFGRLDILVNNAAIRKIKPFIEMTGAEWREVMAINLDGPFYCCRAAAPIMIRGGGGAIVNIGGISAHIGAKGRAHVITSKAGVAGLSRALAVELAEHGITVNCVAPGTIGGTRSATAGVSPIAIDGVPLGREGTIDEAAFVIRMLCQPGAAYTTGQTIHVNGGLYLT